MNVEKLDESEKFIFIWQYGQLGDFKAALIQVIMLADKNNRAKLRLGFPNEVDGYINYSRTKGWWQEVQRKAGISDV